MDAIIAPPMISVPDEPPQLDAAATHDGSQT
jgi:hypothetical protein